MSKSTSPPSWLLKIQSPQYQYTVQRALAEREATRSKARAQSRSTDPNSPLARLQHRVHLSPQQKVDPKLSEHYSVAIGSSAYNQQWNRYLDVEPYDRSRVVVPRPRQEELDSSRGRADDSVETNEEKSGRYINANWVRETFGGKWWIATQAPLPETAHAFLTMLCIPPKPPPGVATPLRDTRPRTVVQLTQNVEDGRRKAHAYFLEVVGQSMIVPPEEPPLLPLKVTLLSNVSIPDARCVKSTISISFLRRNPESDPSAATTSVEPKHGMEWDSEDEEDDTDIYGQNYTDDTESEPVTFTHFLYLAWPDHGVPTPEDRASLLRFARLVNAANRSPSSPSSPSNGSPATDRDLNSDPPIVVGCSAGIGRTGSFIAINSLLRAYSILSSPASSSSSSCTSSSPPRAALTQTLVPTGGKAMPSPFGPLPSELAEDKVAQEVDALRDQRPGMVQRPEQLMLVYELLLAAFSLQ